MELLALLAEVVPARETASPADASSHRERIMSEALGELIAKILEALFDL